MTPRRSARSRLLVIPAVLGIAGLTALGVWQLERRTWKLALIDRVEQRVHAAPQPLPPPASWSSTSADRDEYRHVVVTGQFLHGRDTLVMAVTNYGSGFWVLTPLRTEQGATVLVNRGFVPQDQRDPAARRDGDPSGTVEVTGLLRMSEPKGAFLRSNDAPADRWYSRDVDAIAAAHGLSNAAPFFIDADATPNAGGYPIGGLTVIRFPNNHLIYALTWFTLAIMLAAALLRQVGGRDRIRGLDPRLSSVRSLFGAARRLSRNTGHDARAHVRST